MPSCFCSRSDDFLHPLLLIFISSLLLGHVFAPPIKNLNGSRSEIKHKELLPMDHVAGSHMEHDGDINKDFHHEAFLGTLINEGKLVWENLSGYKLLIDIFHKVDLNGDHRIDHQELERWIHQKILEHFSAAKNSSEHIFKKVDHNKNGAVTWAEYKAQLLGLDPKLYEDDNNTFANDLKGEFKKEANYWKRADYNEDGVLSVVEFMAFQHPEHNSRTIEYMAGEMMPHFDKDGDGKITLEEFTALPGGMVDEEDAELDRQYQEEKAREFKEDMDSDGDNIVTKEELLSYLDPRHKQHASKEADYLIRVSDRDRDKRLSEHEMLMKYEVFTGSITGNTFTKYWSMLHQEF